MITARPVALEGVSVSSSAATGTLTLSAAASADEPPASLTVVTTEDAEAEGVDYGTLNTLATLCSITGGTTMHIVASLNITGGVVFVIAVMVITGIVYTDGTLDPLAKWVDEHKRKRR